MNRRYGPYREPEPSDVEQMRIEEQRRMAREARMEGELSKERRKSNFPSIHEMRKKDGRFKFECSSFEHPGEEFTRCRIKDNKFNEYLGDVLISSQRGITISHPKKNVKIAVR